MHKTNNKIKVFIADDHPIVRNGIKQTLSECNDIEIVGEADHGHDLLTKLISIDTDIVLLDISMPKRSGLSYITDIKNLKPNISILILSIHPEEQYALRAIRLGASGYISKSSSPDKLILAIHKVAQGKKYISSTLAEKIALEYGSTNKSPTHEILSEREFEIMCMLAYGMSNGEIAKELSLSPKTISTYRERILEKMNLNNTADIIRYAIKEKLVD